MKTMKCSALTAAALAAICMSTMLPALASPIEREVDTTGLVGAVPLVYGDHTVNAALGTALEVDLYTFAGAVGDQVRILIRATSGGVDPLLMLREPATGNVLASTSCSGDLGVGTCSAILDRTITSAGIHTINVSDSGLDQFGAYEVSLERYPPLHNWQGMQYGPRPVDETLGHATDMDFFAFSGVAGTRVSVAIRGRSGGIDPFLEVWDPAGVRVVNTGCSGDLGVGTCSKSEEVVISASGIYRVAASDSGWDQVGNYQLEVSCAFGNCPLPTDAAPIPGIPEPSTYAMLALGLGAVAWMARNRRRGRQQTH